jgi:hypothetical protein
MLEKFRNVAQKIIILSAEPRINSDRGRQQTKKK